MYGCKFVKSSDIIVACSIMRCIHTLNLAFSPLLGPDCQGRCQPWGTLALNLGPTL